MLYPVGFLGLVTLVLLVYSLVDIITTDDTAVRNPPRLGWLSLVLFIPLVGSIVRKDSSADSDPPA